MVIRGELMPDQLSQIETDFVEFIAGKTNRSVDSARDIFIATKQRFGFSTQEYREFSDNIHHLFRILYDDRDDSTVFDSYNFYSLMHLFRYISYSYQTPSPYFLSAQKIIGKSTLEPVLLEYGCGQAYFSFEIAKLKPESKIYLLDIDRLSLEFAEYRFKKQGFNAEAIFVTKDTLYPPLPEHTICIATEVMEHVFHPLKVFDTIYASLAHNGILYGNFDDHMPEMFHVTPELGALREKITAHFEPLGDMCFRKVR